MLLTKHHDVSGLILPWRLWLIVSRCFSPESTQSWLVAWDCDWEGIHSLYTMVPEPQHSVYVSAYNLCGLMFCKLRHAHQLMGCLCGQSRWPRSLTYCWAPPEHDQQSMIEVDPGLALAANLWISLLAGRPVHHWASMQAPRRKEHPLEICTLSHEVCYGRRRSDLWGDL